MKKIISITLFLCFMLSSVFAQNKSKSEVVSMDSIDVSSFNIIDESINKADSSNWESFLAKECNLEINMPGKATLDTDSAAFTEDSFVYLHTYQSIDTENGASYTVTCHKFPSNYPFDQNSDQLLQLTVENLLNPNFSQLLFNEETDIFDYPGRQFVIKTGATLFIYGRAIKKDNSIISFVSTQIKELAFEDSELSQFFDSVHLSEN